MNLKNTVSRSETGPWIFKTQSTGNSGTLGSVKQTEILFRRYCDWIRGWLAEFRKDAAAVPPFQLKTVELLAF